jgi:membrane protein implicated in regulation of membrane protease activity
MSYQSSLDRLIGQTGVVAEAIPAERRGTGVIKVAGQLWSAETDWPETLVPQTAVIVAGRTNLILAVLPERT